MCPCTVQLTDEERDGETFVRLYIRRAWLRTWCTMLRYNILACGRDTSEGVRAPRRSTHNRKTGPYPSDADNGCGPAGNDKAPRRPGANVLGTANTPVIVGSSTHDVGGADAASSSKVSVSKFNESISGGWDRSTDSNPCSDVVIKAASMFHG